MIRVGKYSVAVGTDDEQMLSQMKAMYAGLLLDQEPQQCDFGIQLHGEPEDGPGGKGARPIPSLLHGRSALMRSRSAGRLLHRLDRRLDRYARSDDSGGCYLDDMAAIVRSGPGGAAVLVPNSLALRSSAIDRKLAKAGLAVADEDCFSVEMAQALVRVDDGLTDNDPVGRLVHSLAAPAGQYPIIGVVWTETELGEAPSRATRLIELIKRACLEDDQSPAAALQALMRVSTLVTVEPLSATGSDISAVVDLLG